MRCWEISEPFDWHNINSRSVVPGTESFISTQLLYHHPPGHWGLIRAGVPPAGGAVVPLLLPAPLHPAPGRHGHAPNPRPRPPALRPVVLTLATTPPTAARQGWNVLSFIIDTFWKQILFKLLNFRSYWSGFGKSNKCLEIHHHLQIAVIIWKGSNFCQNWVTYVEGRGCSYVSWCPPGCRGRRCPSPASAGPGRRGARCRTRRSPPSPSCS